MYFARPQNAISDSLVLRRHEMINLRPREIISRVDELITEKVEASLEDPVQIFELGRLYGALEFKCEKIEAETTGIWAFFRYFFSSSALTEEKSLLQGMQMSRLLIDDVRASLERETEEKLDKDGGDVIQPEAEAEDNEPGPSSAAPPPPPPPPPPQSVSGRVGDTTGSIDGKKTDNRSAEEKHLASEKNKLERNLNERADPKVFYVETPPKNARELNERKQEVMKDISKIQSLNLPDDLWLKEKQKALANIEVQLKPQLKLLQYAFQKDEFIGRAAKYTNEELRIIIGIMFDGKTPERSHPAYQLYVLNHELLDKIINDWQQLAEGEKGRIFLQHKEEWKRNLNSNRFGFILILRRRMLPEKNTESLREPTYEITPYGLKQQPKFLVDAQKKMPGNVVSELRASMREKIE